MEQEQNGTGTVKTTTEKKTGKGWKRNGMEKDRTEIGLKRKTNRTI